MAGQLLLLAGDFQTDNNLLIGRTHLLCRSSENLKDFYKQKQTSFASNHQTEGEE